MEILKEHPIDHLYATCYKLRSDDDEWSVLTGKVSKPFRRGAKDLRVFYPDDLAEAAFFVSDKEYTVRRGVLWAVGDPNEIDIYAASEAFLEKAMTDMAEARTRIEMLNGQIAFLKSEMVWAAK